MLLFSLFSGDRSKEDRVFHFDRSEYRNASGLLHFGTGIWLPRYMDELGGSICYYLRLCARMRIKLLVLPMEKDQAIYDYHVESSEDAKTASAEFEKICNKSIADKKKAYFCCLALEEIIFNIIEYQQNNNEPDPSIDVHIVIFDNDKMILRIKDCSNERDPFVKYEYCKTGDEMENIGIRIVKSIADDVKYSFIYGVNFISITV